MFEFEIRSRDSRSSGRLGVLRTDNGLIETPAYVIVGTHAEVRALPPADFETAKIQMVIANTYHLWQTLGEEGLNDFQGVHAALGWSGPVMTDSGGFQVFSLGALFEQGLRRGGGGLNSPSSKLSEVDKGTREEKRNSLVRITESGVYFRPNFFEETGDVGEEAYLDAETSIKIQEQLGADIIVAFDEPTSPRADREYTKAAMRRTHAWAKRSLESKMSNQAIYGVVQGGAFEELRRESARVIGQMPFHGFAIGSTYGEGYGGTRAHTEKMLEWSIPFLPEGKPRHLFGVGRIEDLFSGVERGMDTFDCVIPTREARHGGLWTALGRLDIQKSIFAEDKGPIDETCDCPVCLNSETNRSALRELFKDKNPEAAHFATLHNVYFFNSLMEQIRHAIREKRLGEFKKEYLSRLGRGY